MAFQVSQHPWHPPSWCQSCRNTRSTHKHSYVLYVSASVLECRVIWNRILSYTYVACRKASCMCTTSLILQWGNNKAMIAHSIHLYLRTIISRACMHLISAWESWKWIPINTAVCRNIVWGLTFCKKAYQSLTKYRY